MINKEFLHKGILLNKGYKDEIGDSVSIYKYGEYFYILTIFNRGDVSVNIKKFKADLANELFNLVKDYGNISYEYSIDDKCLIEKLNNSDDDISNFIHYKIGGIIGSKIRRLLTDRNYNSMKAYSDAINEGATLLSTLINMSISRSV